MKYFKLLSLSFSLLLAVGCEENPQAENHLRGIIGFNPGAIIASDNSHKLPPVDISAAGSYVILSKTGIANSGDSFIKGNIGVSPASESYITGFDVTDAIPRTRATAPEVFGGYFIFAADMVSPTPSYLAAAVSSMEAAYANAAGRMKPDFVEYMDGDLSGLTLAPGLYKWGSGVIIPTSITITGSAKDVWIFQIAQDLKMSANMTITLGGAANARNIFWVVAGQVDIEDGAHFEGTILAKKAVNFDTGATMNGRVYSQAEVTLTSTTLTQN